MFNSNLANLSGERKGFSIMILFANKLRNHLNDDTLTAMMVLTKYKIKSINLIVYACICFVKLLLVLQLLIKNKYIYGQQNLGSLKSIKLHGFIDLYFINTEFMGHKVSLVQMPSAVSFLTLN